MLLIIVLYSYLFIVAKTTIQYIKTTSLGIESPEVPIYTKQDLKTFPTKRDPYPQLELQH